jgi:hypothetical protein
VDQRGLVERAPEGDLAAFTALVDLTIARLDAAARLIVAALVDPRWRLEIEAEATIPVQLSRG